MSPESHNVRSSNVQGALYKLYRTFMVIQVNPYWCRQKYTTGCCNVQQCRDYFWNLERYSNSKTAKLSISTTPLRFDDSCLRNAVEYLQIIYIARQLHNVFLGSLTDRAIHWTPQLTIHLNRQKLPLSSTTLSFDTPAQRKPAYASYFWKLDSLAHIFVADSMGLSSFNFFAVASKRRIFSAVECASAVQGHPRSIILLPIESVYAVRLPISASLWLWSYLASFLRYGDLLATIAYFSYPSLIRRLRCLCSLRNFVLKLTVRKLESWGVRTVKTA